MKFKMMLAASLPEDATAEQLADTVPFPVYASPKIDGIRAAVQDSTLVSRNGRAIPNIVVQGKFGLMRGLEGCDGELTAGLPWAENVFNRTSSVVMSRDTPLSSDTIVRFNVFDFYDRIAWSHRWSTLKLVIPAKRQFGVHLVEQKLLKTIAQLLDYEKLCRKRGYEGVMLRRADAGGYLEKRSTLREFQLVKLKRFDYGFAIIMAVFSLVHNTNEERTVNGRRSTCKSGMVEDARLIGSVRLYDAARKSGFLVKVPTDELQRWSGWLENKKWYAKRVRYKYQSVGTMEAPRFPTCKFEELNV